MASHNVGIIHRWVVTTATQLTAFTNPHFVQLRGCVQTIDMVWLTAHGTEKQLQLLITMN